MKLKSTLFAGLLAASLAVPAFANDTPVVTQLPQFSAADTQMLFEQDAAPMQLASPAFANEEAVAAPLPQFTTADTQILFEQDATPMQLSVLSQQEMMETEGARYNFRPIVNVWRNTNFDGYNPGTGRIFQVRYNGPPVFRIDYAPNPSPTTLHFHLPPNMNAHRPWYAPWRTY
jgi:hypothetical protein